MLYYWRSIVSEYSFFIQILETIRCPMKAEPHCQNSQVSRHLDHLVNRFFNCLECDVSGPEHHNLMPDIRGDHVWCRDWPNFDTSPASHWPRGQHFTPPARALIGREVSPFTPPTECRGLPHNWSAEVWLLFIRIQRAEPQCSEFVNSIYRCNNSFQNHNSLNQ